MSLDFSDPRLTAYALDELDAAERAEVEAELAGDPERRRLVEEIRVTARLLTEHFQNEPRPKLTPRQREAIEARLQTATKPQRRWYHVAWVTVAASILAIVLGLLLQRQPVEFFGNVATGVNAVKVRLIEGGGQNAVVQKMEPPLPPILMSRRESLPGASITVTSEPRVGRVFKDRTDPHGLPRRGVTSESIARVRAAAESRTAVSRTAPEPQPEPEPQPNTEAYDRIVDNPVPSGRRPKKCSRAPSWVECKER